MDREQARQEALRRAIRKRKGRPIPTKSGTMKRPKETMLDRFRMEERRRLMNKTRDTLPGGMVLGGPIALGIKQYKKKKREKKEKDAVRTLKEDMAVQKLKEDVKKYTGKKTGGLSTGQAKIAAKAPPTNKITGADFAVLRKEKAKGKVMKAFGGRMASVANFKSPSSSEPTSKKAGAGMGSTMAVNEAKAKKVKEITGIKNGKMIRKDPTKAINRVGVKDRYGMDIKPKTSQLGKDLASQAAKAAKATRIGKIAAGVAGVALAAKAGLEKLYEKRTGKKPFTKRPAKKMGGGMMMQRPMMASTGKMTERDKQKAKTIKKFIKRKGGNRGVIGDYIKGMGSYMGGGLTEATQRLKAQGKMGGGMMMRPNPIGMKTGKSVKVKCKLGRNKPTKMY